jgi:hypothetical protein
MHCLFQKNKTILLDALVSACGKLIFLLFNFPCQTTFLNYSYKDNSNKEIKISYYHAVGISDDNSVLWKLLL